jgi:hypothetical protein
MKKENSMSSSILVIDVIESLAKECDMHLVQWMDSIGNVASAQYL